MAGLLSDPRILANDQRFIDEVCRPILDVGNAAGVAWAADISESDPSLLTDHVDQAAANDFTDRVRQRLNDAQEGDATLPDLKRIGAVLGIDCTDPEDSETE